jgi:hypothetical protein
MSTILLIPWIVFGFRHPEKRFIGLTQTRKSILILGIVEVIIWTLLFLLLAKPNPDIAGQGSFAWRYQFFYEKGIFPTWLFAECLNGSLGDKINHNYPFVYLIVSLLVDYVLLFMLSPRLAQIFRTKKISIDR